MRGHEEASGTKYIPQDLFKLWEMKDPIKNYEKYLVESGIINEMKVAEIRNEFKDKIESELKIGNEAKPVIADSEEELDDIYAKAQGTRHKTQVIDNSEISHHSLLTTHDFPSPIILTTASDTPVKLNPPSWKRFCMVTYLLRSLKRLTQ